MCGPVGRLMAAAKSLIARLLLLNNGVIMRCSFEEKYVFCGMRREGFNLLKFGGIWDRF